MLIVVGVVGVVVLVLVVGLWAGHSAIFSRTSKQQKTHSSPCIPRDCLPFPLQYDYIECSVILRVRVQWYCGTYRYTGFGTMFPCCEN